MGSAGARSFWQQLGIRSAQQSCLNILVDINLAILVLSAQTVFTET